MIIEVKVQPRNGKWAQIKPEVITVDDMTMASNIATIIANATGKEVRYNEKGSLQGHYTSPKPKIIVKNTRKGR